MLMLNAAILAVLIQTPAPGADDLGWMAGYWLDCSNGREVSETWSDPRGGLIVGHNLTLRGGRAGFEASHIGPLDGGGLAYFAQPDGAPPTAFRLIEAGPNRAVFENAENDFPNRIFYHRQDDVLTARIEGGDGEMLRSVEWRFERRELNARCPG